MSQSRDDRSAFAKTFATLSNEWVKVSITTVLRESSDRDPSTLTHYLTAALDYTWAELAEDAAPFLTDSQRAALTDIFEGGGDTSLLPCWLHPFQGNSLHLAEARLVEYNLGLDLNLHEEADIESGDLAYVVGNVLDDFDCRTGAYRFTSGVGKVLLGDPGIEYSRMFVVDRVEVEPWARGLNLGPLMLGQGLEHLSERGWTGFAVLNASPTVGVDDAPLSESEFKAAQRKVRAAYKKVGFSPVARSSLMVSDFLSEEVTETRRHLIEAA